jgi:hypothetical protein
VNEKSMPEQATSPQPKPVKRITLTASLQHVFRDFYRGRKIRRVARSQRVDRDEIENIVRDGIREMAMRAPLPTFQADTRDGWGRKKPPSGAVVVMRTRNTRNTEAA